MDDVITPQSLPRVSSRFTAASLSVGSFGTTGLARKLSRHAGVSPGQRLE
jgi:hypothetical protein